MGNFILSGTARALGFRELMGIASVEVGGPYNGQVPADTPSRRAIFVCRPAQRSRRGDVRANDSDDGWRAAPIGGR